MALAPSCILVTGADGFVGRWLVAAIRERFPVARIVGTGLVARHVNGIPIVALDLSDPGHIDSVIATERPDIVVHLAAISNVADANNDVEGTMDINVLGTLRLATALLRYVPDSRFLYVSSSDVYGASFSRFSAPLDEDAPLAPANSYAITKAAADLLVGQMSRAEGLRAIILRPFNHTGPGQDTRFVIPSFARQIAEMEADRRAPVLSVGNLEGSREFLDVRDIVRAYVAAISAEDRLFNGQILNLASGRPLKIRTVLEDMIMLADIRVSIEVDPERYRPEHGRFVGGNSKRALEILGWRPEIPLKETLRTVLDAQRTAIRESW